ncbi:MAG: hypothetical protein QOF46_2365, partial [Paraburkholderia sp.]|nr:hypothetical protein [Paraburkholderia sp.]
MHRAKQRHVLTLHVREESLTAERMGTAHRKTNQCRADFAVTAK